MKKVINIDPKLLKEMYVNNHFSMLKIAKIFGVSSSTIWWRLSELGMARKHREILLLDFPIGYEDSGQILVEKRDEYQLWKNEKGKFGVVKIVNDRYIVLARMGSDEENARWCFENGMRFSERANLYADVIKQMYLDDMSLQKIANDLKITKGEAGGVVADVGIMRSISEARIGMKLSEEHRQNISKANVGKILSPRTRAKMSREQYRMWAIDVDENLMEQMYLDGFSMNDIAEELGVNGGVILCRLHKNGVQMRSPSENWENPIYRKKVTRAQSEGLCKSPNEREELIFSIVEKLCPGEFGLNVNGEIQYELGLDFGGRKPDLLGLNGRKQIILHNGCYWHCCEQCGNGDIVIRNGKTAEQVHRDDAKTLEICKNLGYSVLTVWEHDEDNVVLGRIENFIGHQL